jgi:MoaA/NifB/PqqE/SkfB family radical SAM enzyme
MKAASKMLKPFRNLRARAGCLEGLKFLWLEITPKCNLTCSHCYAGSGPDLPLSGRMTFGDWCRLMDEARAIGCRSVQFIGGEPTLHPDLPRLVEHARIAGFPHSEVFTNATRLDDDLVETFRKCRVRVSFSFYSSDPEVHDRITGLEGSHQRTVAGILKLVKRRVRVRAGVIRMPQNRGHVGSAKWFLRRLGIWSIATDRVRGVGRGTDIVPDASARGELCGSCWSGLLSVDSNGDSFPCVFSRSVVVGNFLKDGMKGILEGSRLRAFRRRIYLDQPEGCGNDGIHMRAFP